MITEFSRELKRRRKRAGLSLKELSKRTETSRFILLMYELGVFGLHQMTAAEAYFISKSLNWPLDLWPINGRSVTKRRRKPARRSTPNDTESMA